MQADTLLNIVNDAEATSDSERRKALYGRYLTAKEYVPIKNRVLTKLVNGNTVINNDPTLVNNKVNLPVDNIIIKTAVGYLLGNAVSVNVERDFYQNDLAHEKADDIIKNYIIQSSWDDVNSDMATFANTCGYGVKILSNIDDRVFSKTVNPWEVILFGSYTEPVAALRSYYIKELVKDKIEDIKILEYYDASNITYYKVDSDNNMTLTKVINHSFGYCPCIGFPINSEVMGRSEKVLKLIDTMDELVSDFSSEITASRYAQMFVSGYTAPEDENEAMKQKQAFLQERLILASQDSKILWLKREIDAGLFKEMYDKLEKNIYSLSATPDMTDENFNTSSGVALSYKMQAFSQEMSTQQRKFIRGFMREFELIANFYGQIGYYIDPLSINFKFNLKEPKNLLENSQIFEKYYGKIPIREALKIAGFVNVETIATEIETMEKRELEDFRLEDETDKSIEDNKDKE
jgi:SPP1 family phage portal protein